MQRAAALAFAAALALAAPASDAAVFDVNRTIGTGSVVGTITTDGTLGALSTSDITAWSLTLNDGTSTLLLTEGNSELALFGSALSATAAQLLFDFGTDGAALFQFPTIGASGNYYCLQGGISSACEFAGGPQERVRVAATGEVAQQGSVAIGTLRDVVEIPAPAAITLFGFGLLGLAVARSRR
jgi:hypothetical protein